MDILIFSTIVLVPPFRETLDLKDKIPSNENEDRLEFRFAAFGKRWYIDVQKNNMLFTNGYVKIIDKIRCNVEVISLFVVNS